MSIKTILREYDERRPDFEQLYEYVGKKLELIVKENQIPLMSMSGRVKTRESLQGKLIKKGDKYDSLLDITDIMGFRLVCYFSRDVDRIAELIAKNFCVNWEQSIDKRAAMDPTVFGYLSLHYICSLQDDAECPEKLRSLEFEFQIRSTLQHVWAEIEHDLGYKSEFGVPREIRREFSRVAGLLEIADDCFDSIRDNIQAYASDTREKIRTDMADVILINPVSLREYMKGNRRMLEFIDEIADLCRIEIIRIDPDIYIRQLEFLGIKTLGQMGEMLDRNRQQVLEMVKNTFDAADLDILSTNAILRFLCRAELIRGDYNREQVEKFLMLSTGDAKRAKRQADRIMKRKENK